MTWFLAVGATLTVAVWLLVAATMASRSGGEGNDRPRLRGEVVGPAALALLVFTVVNAMVSGDMTDNRVVFVVAAACWAVSRPFPTRADVTEADRPPARRRSPHSVPA